MSQWQQGARNWVKFVAGSGSSLIIGTESMEASEVAGTTLGLWPSVQLSWMTESLHQSRGEHQNM